jgi:hypothetical protein
MQPRGDSVLKLVLVVGAILLLPMASYITAYFTRTVAWGKALSTGGSCRIYPTAVESLIFFPASGVESAVTGRDISTGWKPR